ncbi:MAG: hypothetical protein ACOX4J_02530 [Anaerovoracaceae bacterium]
MSSRWGNRRRRGWKSTASEKTVTYIGNDYIALEKKDERCESVNGLAGG